MNKILVIFVLYVASASCVELENLCSTDTFTYKGAFTYDRLLVNAFHRVQRQLTFEPLSYYLINDTVQCNQTEFRNKTNFWEALRAKNS